MNPVSLASFSWFPLIWMVWCWWWTNWQQCAAFINSYGNFRVLKSKLRSSNADGARSQERGIPFTQQTKTGWHEFEYIYKIIYKCLLLMFWFEFTLYISPTAIASKIISHSIRNNRGEEMLIKISNYRKIWSSSATRLGSTQLMCRNYAHNVCFSCLFNKWWNDYEDDMRIVCPTV